MQKVFRIKNKEGHTEAIIRSVLTYPHRLSDTDFIQNLTKNIHCLKSIGYAGFSRKKYLKENLKYNITDEKNNTVPFEIPIDEILETIEEAVSLSSKYIKNQPIHIFLFPTFSQFVKKELDGVSGYTPFKNTLLLFLSPHKTKHWKRVLAETTCHEFMHAVMNNYHERKTLLDDFIFEGIAESFVFSFFKLRKNAPSQVLDKKEVLHWHKKLMPHLQSTELYYPVFLEGKDYPLWTGYSIGFHIIETFRKQNPTISWDKLIRMTPQEIYRLSSFNFPPPFLRQDCGRNATRIIKNN